MEADLRPVAALADPRPVAGHAEPRRRLPRVGEQRFAAQDDTDEVDAPKRAYERLVSELPTDIRQLLARGAKYWSEGPGHLDEDIARLMQFPDLRSARRRLADVSRRLTTDEPVSVLDLTRALWLVEVGLVSVVLGPGDWENVYSDTSDLDAFMDSELALLRRAQDKLSEMGVPASGTDPFGNRARSLRSAVHRRRLDC